MQSSRLKPFFGGRASPWPYRYSSGGQYALGPGDNAWPNSWVLHPSSIVSSTKEATSLAPLGANMYLVRDPPFAG
jgi:hypothetical protein